jgi:hypothetical protein
MPAYISDKPEQPKTEEFIDSIIQNEIPSEPEKEEESADDKRKRIADILENEDDYDEDIEEITGRAIDSFLNKFIIKREEERFIEPSPEEETEEKSQHDMFFGSIITPDLIPEKVLEEEIPSIEPPSAETPIIEETKEEAEPDKEQEADKEIIIPQIEALAEDLSVFIRKDEIKEEQKEPEPISDQTKETTPDIIKETAKEIQEKTEADKISDDIRHAKDDLAKIIEEREKIIKEIEKASNFTAETFKIKTEDAVKEEPEQEEFKKDETAPKDIKPLTPEPEKPKTIDDDFDEAREKLSGEIEKSASFNVETFIRKDLDTTPKAPESTEEPGIITPEETKKDAASEKEKIAKPETGTPPINYDEIFEERRKNVENNFDNLQLRVFDNLTVESNKQDEIDDFIIGLDKIKDNLKEQDFTDSTEIFPEIIAPDDEIQIPQKDVVIPGEVRDLHDEIVKPVESRVPGETKSFNDVFIEDNEMILYNTKNNSTASEEMFKSGNLKSYDDVFFRFVADKKLKTPEKGKETDKKIIGLIWFVIIAAIITILVLIFS